MPQQPNITGLSALGEALSQGGRDYMNITLAQKQRDAARANQLADVADARAYAEQVNTRDRANRLQDEKQLTTQRAQQSGLQILRNEGLLPMDREPTPEEFAAASQQFASMGLDKVYAELLTTPGPDGTPLLSQADKTDPAKVQVAKQSLDAIKAKTLQFSMGQPANAQLTVDSLSSQLAQRKARIQQLSGQLNEPPRQFRAGDAEVLQLAQQLAEQTKPGSGRDKNAVMQMVPSAQKELNDSSIMAHAQKLQSVKEQLNAERFGEANDTKALDDAIQVSKVFPGKGSAAPTAIIQQPTVATPQVASPDQIAAAMRAALGGSAGGASIAVPTNADAETQQLIASQNQISAKQLLEPLDRQAAEIQSEIETVKGIPMQTPAPSPMHSGLGGFNFPTTLVDRGQDKAKKLSSLYLQLKDVQDKKAALEASQLGVPARNMMTPAAPSAVMANPVPTFSAPSRPLFSPQPILQSAPLWYAAPAGG